jgi:hypothetical protein
MCKNKKKNVLHKEASMHGQIKNYPADPWSICKLNATVGVEKIEFEILNTH